MNGTIKTRGQFQRVYNSGNKSVGRYLVVFALPSPDIDGDGSELLVGVVASRKVGNAVRRNRAKRRLRAAFRSVRSSIVSPAWVVLVSRAAAADEVANSKDVAEEMDRLLRKMGLVQC